MSQPVIADELRFNAAMVAGHEEVWTPEFVVHGIYFGEGNAEQGGQHWSFTRSFDDDDGVCIVKGNQEITVFGGISSFTLTRRSVTCTFTDTTARTIGTRRLGIEFMIDDETWAALMQQAKLVFHDEAYFELVP